MKALLFPGQGSQKAGMASEFEKNFKMKEQKLIIVNKNFQVTHLRSVYCVASWRDTEGDDGRYG